MRDDKLAFWSVNNPERSRESTSVKHERVYIGKSAYGIRSCCGGREIRE
jgi:hypothetical protein